MGMLDIASISEWGEMVVYTAKLLKHDSEQPTLHAWTSSAFSLLTYRKG